MFHNAQYLESASLIKNQPSQYGSSNHIWLVPELSPRLVQVITRKLIYLLYLFKEFIYSL